MSKLVLVRNISGGIFTMSDKSPTQPRLTITNVGSQYPR